MWSQFGKPRPPAPLKSFSTENCSAFTGVNASKSINPFFDNDEEVYSIPVGKADGQSEG